MLAIVPAFFFLLPLAGIPASAAAAATTTTVPVTTAGNARSPYQLTLQIDHSSDAAVVIETGRQRRLYGKNADLPQNIPAAAKLMTALVACERLSMSTLVTISKVAAAADDNRQSPDGIALDTGDKYPLEYLLLRLFFYNSDAAALAVAEQLANVESDFVALMNAKAKSLGLDNTVFLNCTGAPVYENASPSGSDTGEDAMQHSRQYTTPADLARLVAYACTVANFNRLIRMDEERMLLDGKTLVAMRNEIQHIWTLSEGRVTGAFYSETEGKTYMVAVGAVKDIKIVAVTAAGSPNSRYADLETIFKGIEDNYVLSPLVEAGEKFTGEQEQTVDGELFGLVFKSTVYYVHPVDDMFVKSTLRYNTFGPHSRPIQRSMTVGQVVFELLDGTTIAVDVCPDRQILSSISILDKALGELQENHNLYVILIVASGLLMLLLLIQVLSGLDKLFRLIQLLILEKRSRR